MKRSDIKVGETYLLARSNDWRSSPTGWGIDKVTVVDNGKWVEATRYSHRTEVPTSTLDDGTVVKGWFRRGSQHDRSTGVLVRVEDQTTSSGRTIYKVAPLGQIRGTWEEATALRAETQRVQDEMALRRRKAEQEQADRIKAVQQRIEDLTGRKVNLYTGISGSLAGITVEDLEALLGAFDQQYDYLTGK